MIPESFIDAMADVARLLAIVFIVLVFISIICIIFGYKLIKSSKRLNKTIGMILLCAGLISFVVLVVWIFSCVSYW